MKNNEEDLIRLSDIADAMIEIQGYVGRSEYNDFATREDIKEAVISQMQQIGGAAALLSDEFKEKYRDIDWDVLKGLQYGNYDQQMELDMMPHWYIIQNDFPDLLAQISDIVTELQQVSDQENEILLDNTDQTEEEVESKVETETYLNQRISEDKLDGDLESENEVEWSMRDKHLPKDFLDDVEVEGLSASEKKILRDINKEISLEADNGLELESLDDMDLSTVDQVDDSFIDQRYEDVDLLEGSSLDDDGNSDDEEGQRERNG
jgi:uncharacterized protein with HEPN domain